MPKVEERLLLLHLYADPKLANALILEPQEFEVEPYRNIYEAFTHLDPVASRSVPLMQSWLESKGYHKATAEIVEIAHDAPVFTDVEKLLHYQKTIRDRFLTRELVDEGRNLQTKARQPDQTFDTLMTGMLGKITDLAQKRTSALDNTYDAIKARAKAQPDRNSWETGMKHIDIATGGMARGEVWILNAAYKGFKTRSALNIAINTLMAKDPDNPSKPKPRSVLYVTYDGKDVDLFRSLQSVYTGLPKECFFGTVDVNRYDKWEKEESAGKDTSEHWRVPRLFEKKTTGTKKYGYGRKMDLKEIQGKIKTADAWDNVPLRIYDGTYPIRDLAALNGLVMADKARFDTDLVIVDYVQAIASGREYEELAKVADALQRIAVEQNVCVLEISQMSNEDIKHGSQSRMLATKGSGDFPATCDVGIEVWRNPESPDPFDIRYILKVARNAGRLVDRTWIDPRTGRWEDGWVLMTMSEHMSTAGVTTSGKGSNKATTEGNSGP